MERRLTRSALVQEHQEQRAEHSDNAQLERQRGTELQTLDSVITGRGRAATATEGPKGVKKRRSDPGRRQEAHDAMKSVSSVLGNIDALIQGDRDKTTTTTSLQTSGGAVQSKILTAGTQTLSAEILWTLKCVDSHYSFHSCKETDKLFKRMFPGHHVSETFSCEETKARYLAEFGLAPHFSSLLKSRIKKDNDYVLLFDESMNSKTKNKQLDIHIRIWHHDKVCTRYLTSQFLGHAAATDLLEHFNAATSDLHRNGLLQVSMDGPSVNWSFYEKLSKQIGDETGMGLLNIGSCGLHVVHGGFQTGAVATGWGVNDILTSAYYLFKDTSARRQDFTNITDCTDFPLKFCKHRWTENGPVCSRVLLLWPHLKSYVQACESKKVAKPTSNSYKTLIEAVNDKLTIAKLSFFRSIASTVEPFLALYQTDKPLCPFLVRDLEKIVRNLLQKCVKSDALLKASTVYELTKIDLEKEKLENSKIEIGFKAENELNAQKKAKAISDLQVLEFREECRTFMVKFVNKILERSPIKYSLARNMVCLDPRLMVKPNDQEQSKNKFKRLLENLNKLKRVDEDDVDQFVTSFVEFMQSIAGGEMKSRFEDFKVEDDRLDELFYDCMAKNETRFGKLWGLVRRLLLISHGQASVERGFSLNRQIEKDNMSEGMSVALRQITDHLILVDGVLKVEITKELLSSASSARHRYYQYLEEERAKKGNEARQRKRKAFQDELDVLKKNKKVLESDIEGLTSSSEKYADEAEAKAGKTCHSLLVKSNALRHTAKRKKIDLQELSKAIEEKTKSLSAMP